MLRRVGSAKSVDSTEEDDTMTPAVPASMAAASASPATRTAGGGSPMPAGSVLSGYRRRQTLGGSSPSGASSALLSSSPGITRRSSTLSSASQRAALNPPAPLNRVYLKDRGAVYPVKRMDVADGFSASSDPSGTIGRDTLVYHLDLGGGLTRAALPHEVEPLTYTGMSDRSGQYVYNGDVLQDGSDVYQVSFDTKRQAWMRIHRDQPDLVDNFVIESHKALPGRVIGNVYENPRLMLRIETAEEIIEKTISGSNARVSAIRDQARQLQDFVRRTSTPLASAELFAADMRVAAGDDTLAAETEELVRRLAARRAAGAGNA